MGFVKFGGDGFAAQESMGPVIACVIADLPRCKGCASRWWLLYLEGQWT